MSGFLCGEKIATKTCTKLWETFAANISEQNFAVAKEKNIASFHATLAIEISAKPSFYITLPRVLTRTLYISSYLENRSRCGETSKEILMEITQCAETHGLLEASAPCFSAIQMTMKKQWKKSHTLYFVVLTGRVMEPHTHLTSRYHVHPHQPKVMNGDQNSSKPRIAHPLYGYG